MVGLCKAHHLAGISVNLKSLFLASVFKCEIMRNKINFVHAQYENVRCKKSGPHSRPFEEMDDTSNDSELKAVASLFNVELINKLDRITE